MRSFGFILIGTGLVKREKYGQFMEVDFVQFINLSRSLVLREELVSLLRKLVFIDVSTEEALFCRICNIELTK